MICKDPNHNKLINDVVKYISYDIGDLLKLFEHPASQANSFFRLYKLSSYFLLNIAITHISKDRILPSFLHNMCNYINSKK